MHVYDVRVHYFDTTFLNGNKNKFYPFTPVIPRMSVDLDPLDAT